MGLDPRRPLPHAGRARALPRRHTTSRLTAIRDDVVIPSLADDDERAETERARRRGVAHGRTLIPRSPAEGGEVVVELTAGPDVDRTDAWVEIGGERRPLELVGAEWDTLAWGYVRTYRGLVPGTAARPVSYSLGVGEVRADGGAPQAYVVGDTGPPAWSADAIVYQVWVDRFWPVDGSGPADRYGGTFVGLGERLDHIERLGANTLWLNPIHPSSAYHGYEVTDYFDVDPGLGTLDDFDGLVSDLHSRGIRLVLDFVAGHVSDRHPAFVAALANERDAHASWFRFDRWPDDYRTFFDVTTMPRLNHDNAAVRAHLADAMRFWLARGVDGFRLDYAGGASYELWAELRVAAREASPHCWLFGEVVDTPAAQLAYDGLIDGCLDVELALALRDAFGYRSCTGAELAAFLDAHEAAFPSSFTRPSFLDNHDLDRMLWLTGGDPGPLRAAALCQFTLAGAPIVYYGTEVGLGQRESIKVAGDRQARLPMPWEDVQNRDLLAFYTDLVALRKELPDVPRENLVADESRLAYSRGQLVVELDVASGSGLVREGADVLLRA